MAHMEQTTIEIIRAGLKGDPTITPEQRTRLLALLRSPVTPVCEQSAPKVPRLIRRAEAANRLSCTTRTIDKMAAAGILRKRKLPGRMRAAGFLESDVEKLMLNNGIIE